MQPARIAEAFVDAESVNMLAEELTARSVSKEYVGRMIQSMSDRIVIVDPQGVLKRANAAMCRLSGFGAEDLEGQKVSDLFPDAFTVANDERGNFVLDETVLLRSTGDSLPVSLSVLILTNNLGELLGLVCVARDLTARKRVEGEARLQRVVESS